MKLKHYIIIGSILILLGCGFMAGWKSYPAIRPCPSITTDTIEKIDSSWYTLKDSLELVIKDLKGNVAYWKSHRDTIKLPGDTIPVPVDVDTAAILKDHFSLYAYSWEKQDSNVRVKDSVWITQNTPIYHDLTYQLLRPQQTIINNIDNSVNYYKYIQGGLYIPLYNYKADSAKFNSINNIGVELNYIWPKGYFGAMWQPMNNILGLKVGTTIYKFKKRK